MNKCKCCGREEELRFGHCWDCIESETAIEEGLDMYDKEIPKIEGVSKSMSILYYILKKYLPKELQK